MSTDPTAPIEGAGVYEIVGKTADSAGWRTSGRREGEPKAPSVVIFATITSAPGATGNLLEMADCNNQILDSLTSFDSKSGDDDSFQLLIGPERFRGG